VQVNADQVRNRVIDMLEKECALTAKSQMERFANPANRWPTETRKACSAFIAGLPEKERDLLAAMITASVAAGMGQLLSIIDGETKTDLDEDVELRLVAINRGAEIALAPGGDLHHFHDYGEMK
jgi:hypothetical protein